MIKSLEIHKNHACKNHNTHSGQSLHFFFLEILESLDAVLSKYNFNYSYFL